MFLDNVAFKNFQEYLNSYIHHKKIQKRSSQTKNYAKNYVLCNEIYSLEKFSSDVNSRERFLIVPSIINDATIFKIGKQKSFIANLSQLGDVYLVNWNELKGPHANFKLDDYALQVSEIIKWLCQEEKQKITLIGYCLGGNIAIASSIVDSDQIKSLILIATPWDFSYMQLARETLKISRIEKSMQHLEMIPAIFMQMLFFMVHMREAYGKFFFRSYEKPTEDLATFFAVENWLFSGTDLTKALYDQLMNEFIEGNYTLANKWYIGERCINPASLKISVLSILGLKDKIVVPEAVRAIYSKVSNCAVIEIDSGHIGFFVGSHRESLFKEIKKWLSEI